MIKKRIILIFPHMVMYGGALNYTLAIAEELQQRGHEVAIATLAHDPDKIAVPLGITVLNVGGPLTSSLNFWLRFFYWQKKLHTLISDWAPDLLIPQVFPANWWGWLIKKKNPTLKLLWICHEPSAFIHSKPWMKALRPFWKSWLARILSIPFSIIDKKLFSQSDAVLANSMFTANNCKNIYGRSVDGIAYPAVNTACFKPKREVPRTNQIITVCHLSKFKNVDFLLRTFAEVLKLHPDCQYVIVGDGEDKKFLQNLSHSLGISKNVIRREKLHVNELSRLYSESALFLHGSTNEPFGMAPLEALACGTPVVAHNSGGPREIVTSSNYGILLDSHDECLWADQISRILDSKEFYEENSIQNSLHAQSFNWQKTVDNILAVLS